MRVIAAIVVSALCLLGPVRAQAAEERITDYASRVVVHADATMTVTETISVIAARDFSVSGLSMQSSSS